MDNAAKALLMAAGVLIAILTISLAVLAFNQMSAYQRSQSDLVKTEQLADFNEQFIQYIRDDLTGIDLVTLANKVVDYNKKESGAGEIDYNQEITLIIDMNNYEDKYGETLFDQKKYTVKDSNSLFFITIKKYTDLEQEYTLKTISTLSSNIESLKLYYEKNDKTNTNARSVSDVIGRKVESDAKLKKIEDKLKDKDFSDLEKYSEYSEFKGAEFKGLEPEYTNGQISKLTFKYIGN